MGLEQLILSSLNILTFSFTLFSIILINNNLAYFKLRQATMQKKYIIECQICLNLSDIRCSDTFLIPFLPVALAQIYEWMHVIIRPIMISE